MGVVKVLRFDHLESTAGYSEFIGSLQAACNLHELSPSDLKWVGAEPVQPYRYIPPNFSINVAKDTPQLSVNLHPIKAGKYIGGEPFVYSAPMLLKDVERWGMSDLRKFKVERLRGVSEAKTSFQKKQSYPLDEFLSRIVQVDASTPVVEAVAFLPIAPNGEYVTEFAPKVSFGSFDHGHYKVAFLMEGGFSIYSALTQGEGMEVKSVNEHQEMHYWQADFVPDLSDLEKLMVRDSRGHMILIAEPVEVPKPLFDTSYGLGDLIGGSDSFRSLSFGPTRGVSIGDVSVSEGSHAGQGSLHEGELLASKRGNKVIYHIKFLGVKPDAAKALDKAGLDGLAKSLGNYNLN